MSGAAPNKLYAVDNGPFQLTAGSTQTAWLLLTTAANSNPITVVEFGVSFNASVSVIPVRVDLYQAASVGAGAGSSASVRSLGSTTTTATTTAQANFTVEPATKIVIASWYIQPFGGLIDIQYPLGREAISGIGSVSTSSLGLQVVTPSGTSPAPSVLSYVYWEE